MLGSKSGSRINNSPSSRVMGIELHSRDIEAHPTASLAHRSTDKSAQSIDIDRPLKLLEITPFPLYLKESCCSTIKIGVQNQE